jgi:ADP-ribosylglycohydrolase
VVARAANHDGDSDSTAAIAGQLWGAAHGAGALPHAWARRLDVLDELLGLAAAWDALPLAPANA